MVAVNLDPLSRLAIQHGTDKFGGHQYTPHYHKLFAARREEPIRLLELGIGGYDVALSGGQSLRMWADYFPYGKIVGIDVSEKRMSMPPRVQMLVGSQDDPVFLDKLVAEYGPFDIIIDDGSHLVKHVKFSFHHLYPKMPTDGIYVVEDVQTAFWENYGGKPSAKSTIFDTAHDVSIAMHALEQQPQPDHKGRELYGDITDSVQVFRNMVAFRRGANTFPSNSQMVPDHPEVHAMHELIASECRRNPAAGASLSRATFYFLTGRLAESYQAVLDGLDLFPTDPDLILAGIRVLDWEHRKLESLSLVERLCSLHPDETRFVSMLTERRAELVQTR